MSFQSPQPFQPPQPSSTPDLPATRFFIAVLPPADIAQYADRIIQELTDRYGTATAKAPPHITLQPPFFWNLPDIATLEACLQSIAERLTPVPITLSGFGSFAPRVLYINVAKTPELLALQSVVMSELENKLGIIDPSAKRRPFAPHLTVASRKMTRQIFKQAWADLKPRSLAFDFVGDRLTLLIHDGHRWQLHHHFVLGKA